MTKGKRWGRWPGNDKTWEYKRDGMRIWREWWGQWWLEGGPFWDGAGPFGTAIEAKRWAEHNEV